MVWLAHAQPYSLVLSTAMNCNGTTFHHHLLVLLVVQELILCVFSEEKVRVTRKYMASLMTSLKRDGFSLTLLKASPFWEECLGK